MQTKRRTDRQHTFWYRYFPLSLLAFLLIIPLTCTLRLALTLRLHPHPQAILVLGGHPDREIAAAKLARYYPAVSIWVSSPPEKSLSRFETEGILPNRLHIDNRAIDTVTNFTTLVSDFERRNIRHLYLITSDFHMARAQAIAFWVLGSRGIAYTPITVSSNRVPETRLHILRDTLRAYLWLFTGRTGASFDDRP